MKRYTPLPAALFAQNRRRFVKQMSSDSLAIFQANDLMPRNGDAYFPFRQNSGLYYLSGIDQEDTVLLLFPDCIREDYREVLFIRRTDDLTRIWEGPKYTREEAAELSGITKVLWLDELPKLLNELIFLAKRIYLNLNENDRYDSEVPYKDLRLARQLMERYPLHKYHRAQPILKKLVTIKSDAEVEAISKATRITGRAFRRVLNFVCPGVMEYEVEAEITHEFLRLGSNHAYEPILGSGPNSCILHYHHNSRQCENGDVILLDFGADWANYAADMTRTIPVNGRFSDRQRNVYDAVLRVLRGATQLLVPGALLEEYQKEVGKMMESELLGLGLITTDDIKNQDPEQPAYKKYFMHGTSHHLGIDVHDLANRYAPVQAGMVFTVEPGIYIPEEGFGIRLENNILVTDDTPIDLMAHIPIEAEHIEEIMNAETLVG